MSLGYGASLDEYRTALESGKLLLRRCDTCKTYSHPKRHLCSRCGANELVWEPASGRGWLYSYSTLEQFSISPKYRDALPYTLGFARLEEGVYLFGRILSQNENLKIGAPIDVEVRRLEEGRMLPTFVVSGAKDQPCRSD